MVKGINKDYLYYLQYVCISRNCLFYTIFDENKYSTSIFGNLTRLVGEFEVHLRNWVLEIQSSSNVILV